MIHRELSHITHEYLSGQKEAQVFPPVPMVYEQVPAEPPDWEYHVLSIDLREHDMPTVAELNELGSQGWLLAGILPTGKNTAPDGMPLVMSPGQFGKMLHSGGEFIHYYFVRQKRA